MGTLLQMALTFAILSVLGFGGGKGIIPQMHVDAVDKFHWVTTEQFAEFYTLGKLVPGPTTIFSALIGYTAAGFVGAVVVTAAMFVPSSLMLIGTALAWQRFTGPVKEIVTKGLAPVVIGLVWSSVFTIGKGALHAPIAFAIAALVTLLVLRTKLGAPTLILMSAVGGAAFLR